jgi:glycosyltransferase involved in cell wall biosynthesis
VLVPAKLLPHKNLGLTVQVAAVLRQMAARPLILLSGAASPHEQPVSAALQHGIACVAGELGVTANLHLLPEITGGAPEGRTIRDLMLLSDLVFLPSAEEGFGMPVQEAAALRAPVLCSDIPAFREIGRDFARFFPLDSTPEHIAACIMAISGSPLNRARRQAVFSAVRFRSQLQALVGQGQ